MVDALKGMNLPLENLKVVDYRFEAEELAAPSYVLPLRGRSIIEDMSKFWTTMLQMMKLTRRPVYQL